MVGLRNLDIELINRKRCYCLCFFWWILKQINNLVSYVGYVPGLMMWFQLGDGIAHLGIFPGVPV